MTVLGGKRQAALRRHAQALAAEARRQGLSPGEIQRPVEEYL